jgi:hypothetical protein
VRDYEWRRAAAAWRAARSLAADEPGLHVVVQYAAWDDPELVPDDIVTAREATPRARTSLAPPPAPRGLLAPPPPTADDAAYCTRCGFRWAAWPRPVSDPCPAGCGRTTWRSTPPPRGPVGGFAVTL